MPSGGTVLVRGGTYPQLKVKNDDRRSRLLTLKPYRRDQVVVDGLEISSSSFLRVKRFRITGHGQIRGGGRRIEIVGNDFAGQPLWLDDTAGVLVERNHIHDIPASASSKIGLRLMHDRDTIVRANRIENLVEDPIQVTDVTNVQIENNTLRNAYPANGEHTDCIHVLGADGLTIRGNNISKTQHCLMFTNFVARNVTIENNVISDIAGTGMKAQGDQGTPNLRLLNNTFHNTGNLSLRGAQPNAVVANNIFEEIDSLGSQPVATHNLITRPTAGVDYGNHAILKPANFADPSSLELAAGSAGIDAGTSVYAPAYDLLGRARVDDAEVTDTGVGPTSYADVGALERTLPSPAVARPPAGSQPVAKRRKRRIVALRVPRRLRLRVVRSSGIRVRIRTRASVRRVALSLHRGSVRRRAVARAVGRTRRGRATIRLQPQRLSPGHFVIVARLRDRTGRVHRTSVRVRVVR
jgi:hypothetical protein